MFKLSIHDGDAEPSIFELASGVHSVGRNHENSLVIDNPTVSDRHCELTVDRGGRLLVRDLGSRNGTYLNGTSISNAVVSPGDILTLGGVVLTLEVDIAHGNVADSRGTTPGTVSPSDSFFRRIPGALAFPLRAELLAIIAAVAGLDLLMTLLPGPFVYAGMIVGLAVGGFLFLTFCATVESTAKGIEDFSGAKPVGLDLGDVKERILSCVLLGAVCFGPFTALRYWDVVPSWVRYSLLAAGLFYFPMALLMVLITDDLAFANPVNVAKSIFRASGSYGVVVLCLLPAIALSSFGDSGVSPGAVSKWIWSAKQALVEAGELYCGFAWARVLGLFYRFNREALDW